MTPLEWDIISNRVNAEQSSKRYKTKSIAFLSLALKQLYPEIDDEISETITDGGGDFGVDAIRVFEQDTSAEIVFFQSKYRSSIDSIKKTINDPEVLKIEKFFQFLFERNEILISGRNMRHNEAVKRIWEIHKLGKICTYKVVFVTNGGALSETSQHLMDEFLASNDQVKYEYFLHSDFIQNVSAAHRAPEKGELRIVAKEVLERSDGDVRGAIATVGAKSFIKMISSADGRSVKRHIFEENLRVYLGNKGGFNPQIIESALSDESYLFWYLNNGITITCSKFSYNKSHYDPVLQLDDFQIVNGAQTSHSLFLAYQEDPDKLSDLVLMVRVYATERQDIAEKVAVATNSQARIQARDLRANHKVLKDLEMAFKGRGYFLERKKGMYSESPAEKRIDALKLGQIILSFYLEDPDKAKAESDSIFSARFLEIFNESRSVDELVALFEVYKIIDDLRDAYTREFASNLETGSPHQYLVYGHWFVLFAIKSLLKKREKKSILDIKDYKILIEEAISIIAEACGQSKAVAHYQMFRSAKTKSKILEEIFGKQLDMFDAMGVPF